MATSRSDEPQTPVNETTPASETMPTTARVSRARRAKATKPKKTTAELRVIQMRRGNAKYWPVDLSQITDEQWRLWYDKLEQAMLLLGVDRFAPFDLAPVAKRAGLSARIAHQALLHFGADACDYLVFPREEPVLTPDDINRYYMTAEAVAAKIGVSKSHVYVGLRTPGHTIRTVRYAGTVFIHKHDLYKLSTVRPRRARSPLEQDSPTADQDFSPALPLDEHVQ